MRIILPPSETKRSGGGSVFALENLAFDSELRSMRRRVLKTLETLSRDEAAAIRALKLGVKSRDERLHNLALRSSGARPAIERYTGVLYDALDIETVDDGARDWIDRHVYVQSALFGMIRAADPIPAYRLSASSRLPIGDTPLVKSWQAAHESIDWSSGEWTLDMRSKDYAALWPLPAPVTSYLHVAQRSDDGAIRALNHFNKAAKGRLVRELALSGADIHGPADLCEWGSTHGFICEVNRAGSELTLILPASTP